VYTLTVFGEVPSNKTALVGVIREFCEYCILTWEKRLVSDPPDGYTGPLTHAPEGLYNVWTGSQFLQLIIKNGKLMVGGTLIKTNAISQADKVLKPSHLEAFRSLLYNSTKVIHVYEEPATGVREYLFKFPEETPPPEHPTANHCKYAGIADIRTGRIVR
jgi:hypothetical protein